MSRNDLCACGSGKKAKKCHSEIREESAVYDLWKKYSTIDEKIENLRASGNIKFLCKRGCTNCCSDYFYISLVEYCLIKNHMLSTNPDLFHEAYKIAKAQWESLSALYPQEYQRLSKPPANKEDMYLDKKFVNARFQPCPCLDRETGECRVYSARPFICRMHGISSALGKCDVIEKYLNGPFGLWPKDSNKHMISIEYNEALLENVEHFRTGNQIRFSRPYPLFYWLANDKDYSQIYTIACARPLSFFAKNV